MNPLGWPKAIVECVKYSRVLWRHMRMHPRIYTTLACIGVSLLATQWLTDRLVIRPARSPIMSFYDSLDRKDYAEAWELLDPQYQSRWNGGLESFSRGYATTVAHRDVRVEGSSWLTTLVRAWRREELEFDVSFTSIDRFTRQQLDEPMQRINVLWLEIANPTLFRALQAGELGSEVASIEMQRVYQQSIVVSNTPAGWRIVSFEMKSTTLPDQ